MDTTVVISEFNMSVGEVPAEARRRISSLSSTANEDIDWFGPAPVSAGILG